MKITLEIVLILILQFGIFKADDELKFGQINVERMLRFYEIRADPLIVKIDRHICFDVGKDSKVSCFCYKGDNNGADDAEGCGKGYSAICINGKYGDFLLYISGEIINLRTMEFSKGAPIITTGKKAKDGQTIPTIGARLNEYCVKIQLFNVYPYGVDSAIQSGVTLTCPKCHCVT